MLKSIALLISIMLLNACDPGARSARIRPDKSADVQIAENRRVPADIYLSQDKLVALQVYGSAGVGRPAIHAIIANNRDKEVRVELKDATYGPQAGGSRQQLQFDWYEGCAPKRGAPESCEPDTLIIPAKTQKRVILGDAAQGEFRLPISSGDSHEEIKAYFKRCGLFGKCEAAP